MTEFKVGDRVKYTGGRSLAYSKSSMLGKLGTVVDGFFSPTNVPVTWDDAWHFGYRGATGVFPENIELVEPRQDTPRVGDTVRVVLEGKVTHVSGYGFDIVAQNTIPFSPENAEHVKSIEIITPEDEPESSRSSSGQQEHAHCSCVTAKPSVKDLPVGSVVKSDAGSVYQKVAPGDWRKAGFSSARPDAEIHLIGWTLLVEKADE